MRHPGFLRLANCVLTLALPPALCQDARQPGASCGAGARDPPACRRIRGHMLLGPHSANDQDTRSRLLPTFRPRAVVCYGAPRCRTRPWYPDSTVASPPCPAPHGRGMGGTQSADTALALPSPPGWRRWTRVHVRYAVVPSRGTPAIAWIWKASAPTVPRAGCYAAQPSDSYTHLHQRGRLDCTVTLRENRMCIVSAEDTA